MLICWAVGWLRPQRQRNRSCCPCPPGALISRGPCCGHPMGARIMLINSAENYILLTY